MARRKDTILDVLLVSPWYFSPLAAASAYLVLGVILPALLQGSPVLQGVAVGLPHIGILAAILLLVPLPFSLLNGRRKARLLDTQSGPDAIRALSWRHFEEMVAEAYRRRGYSVRENQTAGPDGGINIRLERDGQLHLVQCKQWRARKVGVSEIREMYGLLVAQGAASAIVITSGDFSSEARAFAQGKPLDLVDGERLAFLIRGVQSAPPTTSSPQPQFAECPRCGGRLVSRTARRGPTSGQHFLGCSSFPQCRYTRGR